jgi:thymidylate kinase
MGPIPENRRARLVSFSGIDGAGKSTQIETLRTRMEEASLRVLLITFWDDVARLTRIREVTRRKNSAVEMTERLPCSWPGEALPGSAKHPKI